MPTFNYDQLLRTGIQILEGVGASAREAECVARELAEANLVGHDSHGVMRLVQYVQLVQEGFIQPGKPQNVVTEGPAYAVIDGGFNFGQVIASSAFELARTKAEASGTATVFARNCNHVGRLGSYTEAAAKAGFLAMMSVNAPGPGQVAPFGAMERRMGTNPISIAAPVDDGAYVLDMTTSATAEGKLRVAYQKGEMVGPGLMIDGHGHPSSNPADYYAEPNGAILPLGGMLAHKGFGLSVMVDVLCGILSGSGVGRTDLPRGANGVWIQLLKIDAFLPPNEYAEWMAKYQQHIKGAKRQPGVDEILFPGEIENRTREQRLREGVKIPDETWRQISETAGKLNVTLDAISV